MRLWTDLLGTYRVGVPTRAACDRQTSSAQWARRSRLSSCMAAIAVRIASRLVPTYFSTIAAAISKATTFSTITLAAGTAQTSDRSYAAGAGALVAMLTDGPRAARVLIGFLAARMMIGSPLDVPPSIPPALLVGRRKPNRRSSRG